MCGGGRGREWGRGLGVGGLQGRPVQCASVPVAGEVKIKTGVLVSKHGA